DQKADNNNKEEIRYAQVLKKYVHPLIEAEDSISTVQEKFAFGVHTWNATSVKAKNPEMFKQAKQQVAQKTTNLSQATELFDEMVKFKEEEFTQYQRVFIDFEVLGTSGSDYDITVASADLKK